MLRRITSGCTKRASRSFLKPYLSVAPTFSLYNNGSGSLIGAETMSQIRTFSVTPQNLSGAPIVNAPPPTSFKVPVYSLRTGEPTGAEVDLDPSIFGVPVRQDILHRVVVWKLACQRRGTAKTKSRGEIAGTHKKLFPQKGRGAHRVGTKQAPSRRGGAKAHGKKPRDFSYNLPKKIRRLALRCALAAKFAQNKLRIVSDVDLEEPKTNPFAKSLKTWGVENALMVDKESVSLNLYLASRNIPAITVVPQHKANVYDMLRSDLLFVNEATLPYFHLRANGLLPKTVKKKGKYGLLALQKAKSAEIAAEAEEDA